MKSKISKILILLLSTSLLLMGCNNTKSTTATKDENTINIVTSFYPIYISTLNIVKDVPNVN